MRKICLIIFCCDFFLTEVLVVVSKITKTSTLVLSEQQVVFTQNERSTSGGGVAGLWCELQQVWFSLPVNLSTSL